MVIWEKENEKKFILILGNTISFVERYRQTRNFSGEKLTVYKNFFASKTLTMIHWMVAERYTTYNKVIPLYFVPKRKQNIHLYTKNIPVNLKYNQSLFLFPDLWTLRNTIPKQDLENKNNLLLTNNLSTNTRIAAIDDIRRGVIKNIYTTKSEIFQDRRNLKEIIIFDQHKRYYESQQDPRYKVISVIEKMKEVYKISVNYKT